MLSDTKPRGILSFRYRGYRLDRYLYFHRRYRITAVSWTCIGYLPRL
jgi:hypothetical protein